MAQTKERVVKSKKHSTQKNNRVGQAKAARVESTGRLVEIARSILLWSYARSHGEESTVCETLLLPLGNMTPYYTYLIEII